MKVNWNWRTKLMLAAATALPFIYNACGNVDITPMDRASVFDEASSLPPQTKPALAVRGITCLVCHGTVSGDIVTDFGFQNSFFLKQRYDMRADAWSSLALTNGSIFVPKGLLDDKDPASKTIAEGLRATGVNAPIKDEAEVFIGAPTEEVINNLTRRPDAVLIKTEWDVNAYAIGPQSFIRGILAQQGPQGDFFWTNPTGRTIWCEGDVILLGPVHFKDLTLKTSSAGCRIYTNKTVFIQGAVNYSADSGASPNLQISSARAIFMGLRDIEIRMLPEHRVGIRAGPDASGEDLFNQKLIEDRDKIGAVLKEDTGPFRIGTCNGQRAGTYRYGTGNLDWRYIASQQPVPLTDTSGCTYDGDWAGKTADGLAARVRHDYTGMVLNAPKIHGRYLGNFKGLVIGEDVLFAVQHFHFEFDPTFSSTNVLPLLQGRILRIKE